MVSTHRTYPTTFIDLHILDGSGRGDVCGPRLCCSSTCRALIVGLLATERSLLPVRRSGTVCHTTSLTACHWRHSPRNWKLFCFLHYLHYLFSGSWGFYLGHFENFLFIYECMYPADMWIIALQIVNCVWKVFIPGRRLVNGRWSEVILF